MAKRVQKRVNAQNQKLRKKLFVISCGILAAKLILILSVRNGGWLGADGESYLKGVDALMKGGVFSKDPILNYWPAGYPIVLWLLSLVTVSKFIYLVSFFQTILYFAASAFFVDRLRTTRLSRLALPAVLILGLNPTLSLSSLAIGYESLVASCMLATAALIIRYQQIEKSRAKLFQTLLAIGLIQSFSAFMQPRELLLGIAMLIIWAVYEGSWRSSGVIVLVGICISLLLPMGLVLRNLQATNKMTISTNLGATMNIGAGDKASGGYAGGTNTEVGVPCRAKTPGATVSDSELVKCVISWYLHHPKKTAILAIKKSVYFWSPWYGPLANGTMARNPWLKIDPVRNMDTTRAGHELVYGWFGKVVSWIWLIGGLFLLFLGFGWLWGQGGLERQIGLLAGAPVLLAWLTALGTIGDHRFRLPTMGLSLFLQVVGYFGLKERFAATPKRATLEPRGRAR